MYQWQRRQTSNSVQACSDLAHVVLVLVRRVTVVTVHIGLEGVLVIVHFLRSHFVRELLYQEMFSLHPPSVTVDCVDCYRYNHDKFCIKFLLRFMPQMNSWFTEYTGVPVRSVLTPSLWWSLITGIPPGSLPLPPWGGTLWPIFIMLFVLRFLEAVQCRQCFLEVRLTPCRHRIEVCHVWVNPPVATVYVNLCFSGNMTVVFACKSIHFKDDFFRATQLDHSLSEPRITDKSIVNVLVLFLSTPLLKLIYRVVFFATWFLPVSVTVWPALPNVEVRDGEQIQHGWDVLLVFCCIIFHKVSTCVVYNASAPIRQACSALWFRLHVDYLA